MEQLGYHARAARRGSEIDAEAATAIVRRHLGHLGDGLTVIRQRKLYGGSINRVIEWTVRDATGRDRPLVAKVNNLRSAKLFRREMASLEVYRTQTDLPVPRPLAYLEDEPEFDGSGLLMQRIDGVNLSEAKVTPAGMRLLQRDLAGHVVALHSHHRSAYGTALEPTGPRRWLDSFGPVIGEEFFRVRDAIPSATREVIDDIVKNLEVWLPEQSTPTLVHGDLWSNNILVDDRHPDRPEILAFIDVSASYCDPEYELAYLRMFQTADDSFFERYRRRHPLRSGFSRRCRVYWLNTMMMHVRVFGDRYLPQLEDIVRQIRTLG
ncbi:fructosamine kinase family protein [Phycisphaera mikurensis]|uniref:fructosamine kinase family protein n=1 Tax=Phycisphaera mikurensis TaxID=547188 RepID=UPI00069DD2F9|nr:fructosamine kinase family protein [Phycisphaera mikurensis]MBB6442014.1 fructosamine-3-kinase [Phycisphaera mikurensis]